MKKISHSNRCTCIEIQYVYEYSQIELYYLPIMYYTHFYTLVNVPTMFTFKYLIYIIQFRQNESGKCLKV